MGVITFDSEPNDSMGTAEFVGMLSEYVKGGADRVSFSNAVQSSQDLGFPDFYRVVDPYDSGDWVRISIAPGLTRVQLKDFVPRNQSLQKVGVIGAQTDYSFTPGGGFKGDSFVVSAQAGMAYYQSKMTDLLTDLDDIIINIDGIVKEKAAQGIDEFELRMDAKHAAELTDAYMAMYETNGVNFDGHLKSRELEQYVKKTWYHKDGTWRGGTEFSADLVKWARTLEGYMNDWSTTHFFVGAYPNSKEISAAQLASRLVSWKVSKNDSSGYIHLQGSHSEILSNPKSYNTQTLTKVTKTTMPTGLQLVVGAEVSPDGKSVVNRLSSTNDVFLGSDLIDRIFGLGGADKLKGNGGNDRICGGAGSDKLWGGSGKDAFVFTSSSDSTVSSKGRDTIYDFAHGDRIDLSAIDASSKQSGNQAFTWIGTHKFSGHAGELRFEKAKSDTYVYADTNGDKHADLAIHLDDAVTLVKGDFVL